MDRLGSLTGKAAGLIQIRESSEVRDPGRDAALSLRWETKYIWPAIVDAINASYREEHLAAVMLAAYVEATGQRRCISYSRSKSHYDVPERYKSWLYKYRKICRAVDRLEELGLIEHRKAVPGVRGWQSSMKVRPELVCLVKEAIEGERLKLAHLRGPILLRDAEGNLLDYRDTKATVRMRRQMQAQNEMLAGIDLGPGQQHLSRLRRIFAGSFDRGGRFYAEGGGWQTLSKAERLKLEIDGQKVVEVDYAEFHPALAYAECGLPAPDNAYEIEGTSRDLVKIAFNILLNGSSRNGARYELAHHPLMARRRFEVERAEGEGTSSFDARLRAVIPDYDQQASRAAEALIESLLAKHDPIRSMFFCGAGLRLQRRDSDIAEAVMERMRRHAIVVLPVHDSFLVPETKADLLEQVMIEEAAIRDAEVKCKRSGFVSAA